MPRSLWPLFTLCRGPLLPLGLSSGQLACEEENERSPYPYHVRVGAPSVSSAWLSFVPPSVTLELGILRGDEQFSSHPFYYL